MHSFTLFQALPFLVYPAVPNFLNTDKGYDLTTFPAPDSPLCLNRSDYHSAFICDPDSWLSREAFESVHLLFISSKMRMTHCLNHPNRLPCPDGNLSQQNSSNLESAHLVMVNKVTLVNASRCEKFPTEPFEEKNLEVEEVAYENLMRFATSLLHMWNSRDGPTCVVDILLMMVKEVVLCDRGSRLTLRNHQRPTLVVTVRGEDDKLFLGALKRLADENNRNVSLSSIPQRVENALVALEPLLETFRKSKRSRDSPESCPPSGRPNSNIPTWAITTIVVSLFLIVVCTFVGYLVNNRSQTLRICDPNPFTLIDFTRRKRKWRAGFGGGLI
ncbi:hypothetical protein M514_12782 [Trichuris suis]|uniref:Uncharacterized protein n=1 Tax=Trichuris suis TaxID=68888 RepID=A0A085NHY7_9BILA|nr:hypothetical protein M513_12782 [Trichuris suis]KFD69083.1 hypothetical protein M514_12782 [Trichuris suis]